MKNSIKNIVLFSLFLIVMFFTIKSGINDVMAKEKKPIEAGNIYKEDKYIYYTVPDAGSSIGLTRYNTKTGKEKEIKSVWRKNGDRITFSKVLVKGKYIYSVWTINVGFNSGKTYIYRMNKNGKNIKRLACGDNLAIKGNRLYYDQAKLIKENGECNKTELTGKKYSMKLNGKDKREETDIEYKKTSWNFWKKDTVIKGNYKYFIKNNNILLRKNRKTGKKEKIFEIGNSISSFSVAGGYIQIIGTDTSMDDEMYFINLNGEDKLKIREWLSANF